MVPEAAMQLQELCILNLIYDLEVDHRRSLIAQHSAQIQQIKCAPDYVRVRNGLIDIVEIVFAAEERGSAGRAKPELVAPRSIRRRSHVVLAPAPDALDRGSRVISYAQPSSSLTARMT